MMKIRIFTILTTFLLFSTFASADILQSTAGLKTCVFQSLNTTLYPNDCSPKTMAIPAHPAWEQPDDTGSQWISYAHTGYRDSEVQPTGLNGGQNKIFTVYQPIALGSGYLQLRVWADDTAGVRLVDTTATSETLLFGPKFTQSTCSGQPIGCRPQDAGIFVESLNAAHEYELQFDVYQVGTGTTSENNPMGLLYVGSTTPEPGSILLLGTLLLGTVGLLRRKLT